MSPTRVLDNGYPPLTVPTKPTNCAKGRQGASPAYLPTQRLHGQRRATLLALWLPVQVCTFAYCSIPSTIEGTGRPGTAPTLAAPSWGMTFCTSFLAISFCVGTVLSQYTVVPARSYRALFVYQCNPTLNIPSLLCILFLSLLSLLVLFSTYLLVSTQ